MGTSPWSNDQSRDLVVPPGAGPDDPRIVIGPDVPDVINDYYALHYGLDPAVAWIGEYLDADHYAYQAVFTNNVNLWVQANGWVVSNTVKHTGFSQYISGLYTDLVFGDDFNRVQMRLPVSRLIIGSAGNSLETFSDLQFQAVSASRGVVAGTIATGNTTVTTSGTAVSDLPKLAIASAPLWYARMYELGVRLYVQQSVATDTFEITFRRDTAVTGGSLGVWRFCVGNTNDLNGIWAIAPFQETTDETVNLFVDIHRVSGTGTCKVSYAPAGGLNLARTKYQIADVGGAPTWVNAPSWQATA